MSLKSTLQERIRIAGYLSFQEVENLAKELGRKVSNAERRLRPSESPMIIEVKNSKGFIQGYRHKTPALPPAYKVEKKHSLF